MEQQNIESGNCISVSLSLSFPQRRIPYTNRKKNKVVFFLSFLFFSEKKNYILKTRSIDYCYVKNEVHISLSLSVYPLRKKNTDKRQKPAYGECVCVWKELTELFSSNQLSVSFKFDFFSLFSVSCIL